MRLKALPSTLCGPIRGSAAKARPSPDASQHSSRNITVVIDRSHSVITLNKPASMSYRLKSLPQFFRSWSLASLSSDEIAPIAVMLTAEHPVDHGSIQLQCSRSSRKVNASHGKQWSKDAKSHVRESLGFRVEDQARNPIRRPPVLRPKCFSFAASARLIYRSSNFSLTSHFSGSGSLPVWRAFRQLSGIRPTTAFPVVNPLLTPEDSLCATALVLTAYILDGTTYPLRARHLPARRRGALP